MQPPRRRGVYPPTAGKLDPGPTNLSPALEPAPTVLPAVWTRTAGGAFPF